MPKVADFAWDGETDIEPGLSDAASADAPMEVLSVSARQ